MNGLHMIFHAMNEVDDMNNENIGHDVIYFSDEGAILVDGKLIGKDIYIIELDPEVLNVLSEHYVMRERNPHTNEMETAIRYGFDYAVEVITDYDLRFNEAWIVPQRKPLPLRS